MHSYPKALLFLLTCSIANAVFSRDFAEIQADIHREETKFRNIETQQGNFSPRLLESLDSLVKLSLMANRLGDAGSYIDRALQIIRLEGFDSADIDNFFNNLARLPFDTLALTFREVSPTVSVSGD